jgi:hypothetical protein
VGNEASRLTPARRREGRVPMEPGLFVRISPPATASPTRCRTSSPRV